jgi:hypothetical protein
VKLHPEFKFRRRMADGSRMNLPERSRTVLVAVALITGLALPSAAAASATVSGKVRGADRFTMLELAQDGRTISVVLGAGGAFRVPARRGSTLQLIKPNGIYFGPLLLAHKAGKGWDALTGKSLKLGAIALHNGYASPLKMPALARVKTSTWFHVTADGSPLGAGHLGFIPLTAHQAPATRQARAQARARAADAPGPSNVQTLPPGGDPDQDGVPTAFNAGSAVPGEPAAENAQAAAEGAGGGHMTQMNAMLEGSVNADAPDVTAAEVSQQVQNTLGIDFGLDSSQAPAGTQSVSVDCGALSYCSGITVAGPSFSSGEQAVGSIWNGVIPPSQNSPGTFSINVKPNAPLSAIQPGDTFMINYQTATGVVQVPTSLTTMFVTVPALAAIGQGDGAEAASSMQSIDYPADDTTLGTVDNPVMMTGDSIHVSFWRPQRAAFPGETGPYMDLGHLHYGLPISGSSGNIGCAESDFSDLSPTLSLDTTPGVYTQMQPLLDSADDAAPDPSNQLGATLNLSDCLEQNNQPTTGAELAISLTAADAPQPTGGEDTASQMFYVCLPGCTVGQVAGPGGQTGQGPGPSLATAIEPESLGGRLSEPWPASAVGP